MKITTELLLKIMTPLIAVAIAWGVMETKIEHFESQLLKILISGATRNIGNGQHNPIVEKWLRF